MGSTKIEKIEEKKVKVRIDFLKEGSVLAGDTFDEDNNFLFKGYTVFTKEIIEGLKLKGIKNIYYTPAISVDDTIESFRGRSRDMMEIVLDSIKNNVKLNIGTAKKLVDDIYDKINRLEISFLPLMKLREYDDYTYTHSVNVGILSMTLAKKFQLDDEKIKEIGLGAFFHDVGKLMIPKEILNKSSALSDEEFKMMKDHPLKGYTFLKQYNEMPELSLDVVCHHHEYYNGKGYPESIDDSKLTLGAKIAAICDVYDALTSERPYKRAFTPREAITTIMQKSGSHFNPVFVSKFIRDITPLVQNEPLLPLGSAVVLNTGEVAQIVGVHSIGDLMPVVSILTNSNREKLLRPFKVDLTLDAGRKIIKIIPKNEQH